MVGRCRTYVKAAIAPYKYPRAIEFVRRAAADGDRQAAALPAARATAREPAHPGRPMRSLQPAGWPRPHGYANGVAARGTLVFVAGQIGWNVRGEFVSDDFVAQAQQALAQHRGGAREPGAGPEHLVRLTWYVVDRASTSPPRGVGAVYREVIGRHSGDERRGRSRRWSSLGAKVEIEATAVLPDA